MDFREKIIIIDLGSQYTQLIARRVRSLGVYCEIHTDPPPPEKSTRGIILSGSPHAVHEPRAPKPAVEPYLRASVPVLGICYGAQWMVHREEKGAVATSERREYGPSTLRLLQRQSLLFSGIAEESQVWMSHSDSIERLPPHFETLARTDNIAHAAFQCVSQATYGLQFHPEVVETTLGTEILRNYLFKICTCQAHWAPRAFLEEKLKTIRQHIAPNERVLMALSGGVDSSVAALLIHRAVPGCLCGVFIDNGFLRAGEYDRVRRQYKKMGLSVRGIRAKTLFYKALAGVKDPERKRKLIGRTFVEVFERHSKATAAAHWLGQGTIYPDVIESLSTTGPSQTIKSHHNVGGLPKDMSLQLIEPLRMLFKDEVREVGRLLGLPEEILQRHPFPGPGLAIRILGAVTPEKVRMLRTVDDIFIGMLKEQGLYDKVWQAGVILLPVRSTGVMGDARTYQYAVALRAVCSVDGMTATWAQLPHAFLSHVSGRIVNEVRGVNRVTYDISSKPPSTIEWE